jgi:hypothetical protein
LSVKVLRCFASTVLAVGICASCEAASLDPDAADFVARLNKAVTLLAGKTGKAAYSSCESYVETLIDVDSIAERTAGAAWAKMTADQRDAYRAALEKRAVRNCVSENANNSGKPVGLLGMRESNGGRLLATLPHELGSGPERTVVWRLPDADSTAQDIRAVDVLIDGRSTVLTLRDEARNLLEGNNGDINALIAGIGR